MAVGLQSKTIAQSLLCLALAVTLFVPLSNAEVHAANIIVNELRGDCSGSLSFVPLQTRLYFDDKASMPATSVLTGSSIRIERAEGTDAHVGRGPLGSANLYSNYRSEVVETVELDAFGLDLTDFLPGSTLTVMPPPGATSHWASATIPNGFDVMAPIGEVASYSDPRDAFYSEPPALRTSAALTDLTIVGDLRFLVEQTEFRVRANERVETYRAEHASVANGDTVVQVRYYILHITDARLVMSNAPVSGDIYADILDIRCVGAILDAGVTNATPIATGILELSPRRVDDAINVDYTVQDDVGTAPAANQVGIARSAFPYWGLVVAFGLIGTGGGVAVWRGTRKGPPAPLALGGEDVREARTPGAPTIEPPSPRTIPSLEQTYRDNPANTVVALELGLAYAKDKRPHEALPLLQLAIQEYPKMDAARYFAGIALLDIGRIDDGLRHLAYSFRLNALNVARFINEGAALAHGHEPRVRAMLAQWSRQFQDANARGYV